jgi:glutathione S-transferase
MKLYTHALSPFSAKVRIALDEKGVEVEEIALPISRTAVLDKPAELLDANPRGQVPTLIDGSLRLYDSTVILEYLEERHPVPPLLPADARDRARARLLEDQGDWLMDTAVADLLAEVYRKTDPAERDPAAIERASGALQRAFAQLGRELGAEKYFCGEFSFADLSLYLPVSFGAFFGVVPEPGSVLAGWLDRVQERPSVARERAGMLAALAQLGG